MPFWGSKKKEKEKEIGQTRMKCTLIVESGGERSQRSCEMTELPTTRQQMKKFLQIQDLRLESNHFDYTVSISGMDDTRTLKTDADVRLFLAQAKHLGGGATFHVHLRRKSNAAPDMESALSAKYAIDLDLVTLHIYVPGDTDAAAATAVAPLSHSHSRTHQEKLFVVPKRFVLDSLIRSVKDTLNADTLKKNIKLTLYSLSSSDDVAGVALLNDTEALNYLHAQAKRREPARLTYTIVEAQSPHALRGSQQQHQSEKTPLSRKPSSPSPPLENVAPRASKNPTPSLPPLHRSEECTPVSTSTKSNGAALHAAKAASTAAASDTRRSTPHLPSPSPSLAPSPSASSTSPYTAARAPASSAPKIEVPVEVRREENNTAHAFTFLYSRTDTQLCSRFSAECSALFPTAAGAPVLTLSNDSSVVIDGDGVLRELLALAREAQQPLRVRLRRLSPPKSRPSPADHKDSEALPQCTTPMKDVVNLRSSKPTPNDETKARSAAAPQQKSSGNSSSRISVGGGDTPPSADSPHASSQPRLPSLVVSEADAVNAVAGGKGSTKGASSSSNPAEKTASPAPVVAASSVSTIATSGGAEEDGGPKPVMSTIPGTSDSFPITTSPFTHQHLCLCAVDGTGDGNDTVQYRLQISIRWGSAQRMARCRVKADHFYNDVRRGVLQSVAEYVEESIAPSLAMIMELVRTKEDGTVESLPLTETTPLLNDLLTKLYVESTELRVLSPVLPSTLSNPRSVSSNGNALPADDTILPFIAAAIACQLVSVSLPLTVNGVHTLMSSLLGEKASTEPFQGFLSKFNSKSENGELQLPPSPEEDGAAAAALQTWFQQVLTDLSLCASQTQTVLLEIATSLRSTDFRDDEYFLNSFFAGISSAVSDKQNESNSTALRAIFEETKNAATAHHTPAERECTDQAIQTVPMTKTEWKSAFDGAPSIVLDVIAAAHMDELLKTSPSIPKWKALMDDEVWRDAFHKAQLHFCEVMAPAELESYFNDDKLGGAAGDEQLCRNVLLSCMGALLAPAPLDDDYGAWLVSHFCGRVGVVLYAKMGAFDGHTGLSLPSLTILSWTILNPQLFAMINASTYRAMLMKLVGWVRVAVAHACYVRGLSFPPCPLYHVHASRPAPLSRELMPPRSDAKSVSEDKHEEKSSSQPPTASVADTKAAEAATTAPMAPSPPVFPPPLAAAQAAPRKRSTKKVQYAYKFNFNSLQRPRSSSS